MTEYRLEIWNSAAELRAHANAWDSLWQRAEPSPPSARAWPVAAAIERQPGACRVLAVRQQAQLRAVLPLVARRYRGLVSTGQMASSPWTMGGRLLIDMATQVPPVADLLIQGLRQLPWPLVWCDAVEHHSATWQLLDGALAAAGMRHLATPRFPVGLVHLPRDFAEYRAQWSRNLRRQLQRGDRKLSEHGPTALRFAMGQDALALLDEACRVEHCGWKGSLGSSLVSTPGAAAYLRHEAELLQTDPQFCVALLQAGLCVVACQIGYLSHGVYWCLKIAFNPRFAAASPGQVLMGRLLEHLVAEHAVRQVDFVGPLIEATARWSNDCRYVGRRIISPGGWVGRCCVAWATARASAFHAEAWPLPALATKAPTVPCEEYAAVED